MRYGQRTNSHDKMSAYARYRSFSYIFALFFKLFNAFTSTGGKARYQRCSELKATSPRSTADSF